MNPLELFQAQDDLNKLCEYWQSKDWSDPKYKYEREALIYAFQTFSITCKNVIWRTKDKI